MVKRPELAPGFRLVAFVVFAALAIHAAGGFEHVLRVEAGESASFQDLIHGVLRDHHPLRRVRHRKRLVQRTIDNPHDPTSRTRTGHKLQVNTSTKQTDQRTYCTSRLQTFALEHDLAIDHRQDGLHAENPFKLGGEDGAVEDDKVREFAGLDAALAVFLEGGVSAVQSEGADGFEESLPLWDSPTSVPEEVLRVIAQ